MSVIRSDTVGEFRVDHLFTPPGSPALPGLPGCPPQLLNKTERSRTTALLRTVKNSVPAFAPAQKKTYSIAPNTRVAVRSLGVLDCQWCHVHLDIRHPCYTIQNSAAKSDMAGVIPGCDNATGIGWCYTGLVVSGCATNIEC